MSSKHIFWMAILLNLGVIFVHGFFYEFFSWVSAIIACNLMVLVTLLVKSGNFLKEIQSLLGCEDEKPTEAGIKELLINSNAFVDDSRLAIAGISQIGHEEFTSKIGVIKNESIRASLLAANNKIIELRAKEIATNWVTSGVAAIAELKHQGNNISDYSFQAISSIVKYLKANQGGFFLLKNSGEEAYFELQASYAYGKKKYVERRINPGEGLIGQLFFEREMIYMTEVPPDYIKITSGLGEALPRCVCIVPLISEGNLLGAIEIASFSKLSQAEMEYLQKIGERIGYNLNSIETHRRTELLLQESQTMAQEVKAQEEELRQNMEELTATQEEMSRKQVEMDAVFSSLSTVELDLNGKILNANSIFLGITGYVLSDIQGKPYKSLTPQTGNEMMQYDMMWSSILSGQSFSGEFKIVNKAQKEMWMAGNFTPLSTEHGQPYKIMLISLFTNQDKEKLVELQEMVNAFKNCFPISEINPDMTFKSANDLFLSELGIKRLELKKSSPRDVLVNGSCRKVEEYLGGGNEQPNHVLLEINNKSGSIKRFASTLIKINSGSDHQKKGLLILRNPA